MSTDPQTPPIPAATPAPPVAAAPPAMLGYAPPPERGDLRDIAVRQKVIMYCILGYIAGIILQLVLPHPASIFGLALALAATLTGAVFVFMLSIALFNPGTGIVMGLLTLVPLIGLIILLVINGRATNELRKHGIRVGLMGAPANQIPAAGVMR